MFSTSGPVILPPDREGVVGAANALREGKLVAVPTETVYGLAARADREEAVQAIYRAKGRPSFNPLIVHVADIKAAGRIAELDKRALRLAEAFWPGALTMVLPLRTGSGIAPSVTAGLATVALRSPDHPVMRNLLRECGLPLAAPSANRSGAVSPTNPEHVIDSLGNSVDFVLDGGPCRVGLESTIVALRDDGSWEVLRPGPVAEEQIANLLGPAGHTGKGMSEGNPMVEAPGQLVSHYSPGKPVRLDAETADEDEFHIGFGAIAGDINLSPSADLAEAASNLYSALHQGAASLRARLAVAPIPEHGAGRAIRDRLNRAAAEE